MFHKTICVVGLGYVGLPLARLFATKYKVIGFDINTKRVDELKNGIDSTEEVTSQSLLSVLGWNNNSGLLLTSIVEEVANADIYIITVPTPIDKFNKPDLTPLEKSSTSIAKYLSAGNIVIYESTVYPGVTEEICVPILENVSGLKYNSEFFVGYSPERINPGDKLRTVEKILKITSGSTPEIATEINNLYESVIEAGTYKASSIKVAEAAKVIENAQRDINIAFVNELAKIFAVLNIDTQEVLAAAGTKWNFLPFQPGLVGGHCIGVDPFYLAEKAKIHGYYPELILAGRRMNDSMGGFIAEQVVKGMIKKDISIKGAPILILGVSFKENCPDIRNSKILDVYNCLLDYDCQVDIYDPIVDAKEVLHEYKVEILSVFLDQKKYAAIILGVAHQEFSDLNLNSLKQDSCFVYDVKGFWGKTADGRL